MKALILLPLTLVLASGSLCSTETPGASRAVISKAMSEELDRNLRELSLPGLRKPFFLACRVRDAQALSVQASLGSLVRSSLNRRRLNDAEALVGDYQQNQSNFLSFADFFSYQRLEASLDDNAAALRRGLWSLLDAKYKKGAEQLGKKIAVLQQQQLPEELLNLPDLSKTSPRVTELPQASIPMDQVAWEQRAKSLSEVFRKHSGIQRSSVSISLQQSDDLYQNSEGTKSAGPLSLVVVRANFSTQAKDGRLLQDMCTFVARRPEELPSQAEMLKAMDEAAATLVQVAQAPLFTGSYSGPVLVEGPALADLMAARFFSPSQEGLLACRRPIFGSAQEAPYLERQVGKSMEEKLDTRVLPATYTLKAQPQMERFQGHPLAGSFRIDAEGMVPEAEVILVEKGMLRNLLSSRVPTPKVKASNGHLRPLFSPTELAPSMTAAVAPGVVSLEVGPAGCKADLKAELIKAAKDSGLNFAYIIRRMTPAMVSSPMDEDGSDEAQSLFAPLHIYRVSVADGREELVRNAQLGTLSVSAMKHILGANHLRQVHNLFLTPSALRPNLGCAVSLVLPNGLLFEELEIRKPKPTPSPSLPVVESPLTVH